MQSTQSDGPYCKKDHTPPIAVGEAEAAKAIGISVFFLRKDRRNKRLIPFIRLGDRCLYDLNRVRAALLQLEEGGCAVRSAKRRAQVAT
jgi:hypothetical protein